MTPAGGKSGDKLTTTFVKAGITEHSVMFPADMIKVTISRVASPPDVHSSRISPPTDTDAGLHRITGGDVHGHRQRIQSDICDGGFEDVVEGCLFSHLRSRSRSRGALRYLRVYKRANGWERGW